MVNKTVLSILLFTLFTFTLAESWDIYFYNAKTSECTQIEPGCQSCDADPIATISYQVTCSSDTTPTAGLTNCKVQIFPGADCTGTGVGPAIPIVDATYIDYDNACDYLEANTAALTCNIIGQPDGASNALVIILVIIAVVVVIGIVVAVAAVGFVL